MTRQRPACLHYGVEDSISFTGSQGQYLISQGGCYAVISGPSAIQMEGVEMQRYDPSETPNPEEWLSTDEAERIRLVSDYHRWAKPRPPNPQGHAVIHVIVENQIALGEEYPVQRTADRLIGEGLDRHEAIHAIGSVLAEHLYDIFRDPGSNLNDLYLAALAQLTAAGWRG